MAENDNTQQSETHTVVSGTVTVKMEDSKENELVIDLAKMLYANTNFDNTDKSPAQLAQIAINRALVFASMIKS